MNGLETDYLLKLRSRALRNKVWFKCLNRIERALLSLVPRCVKKVKSPTLMCILTQILAKIHSALKNPFEELRSQAAKSLTYKIVPIARSWGNRDAEKWVRDDGFIRFLAIIKLNESKWIPFQTGF